MCLFEIFGVYQDIIHIHYNKNVEFFGHDFINITLKTCWNVVQAKKYHLIFEIAILDPECNLLFIVFLHFDLIICIYQTKLDEFLGMA